MKRIILVVAVIAISALVLQGDTYDHSAGGISIWFPDNWEVTAEGDDLEAEAPGQDAFALLMVMNDISSLEEGIDAFAEEVGSQVQHFKIIAEGEDINLNGLTCWFVTGEGVMEDVDVEVGVCIIATSRAIVLMLTINTEESGRRYKGDFENIINSIRPV